MDIAKQTTHTQADAGVVDKRKKNGDIPFRGKPVCPQYQI